MKPEDEKTEKEKITEEIEELKARIKNTEYDLANMFKGNSLLEEKLAISKKSLEEKSKLLQSLSEEENKDKSKELEAKEDEIIEDKEVVLSKDQEDIIEKELDKEIV
ncbi:MAG: hypothetical protein WC796_04665 [Candidatus Pacearchaeota archaeon]|jgi:hypothetical protein